MALSEYELLNAYRSLIKGYPEDLHIARCLIDMLLAQDEKIEAREMAMLMARRMLSLGHSIDTVVFLDICEQLEHPETDEIASMRMIAELTGSHAGQHANGEGKVFGLIEGLSDSEAKTFLKQGEVLLVAEGQSIVKQGEISRNFYLILEGELHVHMDAAKGQHIELNVLTRGDFFGEFACVYQLPRMATVTACSDVTVLEFTDTAVADLITYSPLAGENLMKFVRRRMIESLALSHEAFREVEKADRGWFAHEGKLIEYMPFAEINPGILTAETCFYVVIYGKIIAVRHLSDGRMLHVDLNANAMFSGGAHMLGFPEGVTLQVPSRCLVCRVPIEIFKSFSNAYRGFENWVEQHAKERNGKLEP